MSRFVVTPAARADLRNIEDYLLERSVDAAARVRAKLHIAFQRLAEMPRMGHARPDLTDHPYLFWPVYSYLIVYDPATTPIRIMRVFHGAQDVGRILREPP